MFAPCKEMEKKTSEGKWPANFERQKKEVYFKGDVDKAKQSILWRGKSALLTTTATRGDE